MKRILVAAAALTLITGAAIAQTSSPTQPRSSQPGGATQSQPSQAQIQRCQQLSTEAERSRCLNNLRPGAGSNPAGRTPNTAPAERTSPGMGSGSGSGMGSGSGTSTSPGSTTR